MSRIYLAYLAATFVLVVAPGATTAVVVRNTLAYGHRAGLLAAWGAAAANVTHATLAALGLWVLIGRWPAVLDGLRLGGAAYLAWLGVKALRDAWAPPRAPLAEAAEAGPPSGATHRSSFLEGLTFNLLNPAIISFYLAVVPTFIPSPAPRYYFALLAATHVGLALACHAGWATAFHGLRRVFARRGVRVALELATAAAMLWLSGRVLGRLH